MTVKSCKNCSQSFIITPDDQGFYDKIGVPEPTFCPDCRRQRRMTWWNEHNFYSRTCAKCNKGVLSIYSKDKPRIIYCPKCWWNDNWDAKDYGQDIDFSKDFYEQYKELLQNVPTLAIYNDNNIVSKNCEYTNYFARGKDCYLTNNCWKVENIMYSVCILEARDIVDSGWLYGGGEQLYHAIYTMDSSRSRFVYNSSQLVDCAFCFDCRGCTNCFMSANLRNKSYCYKNEQYSKEQYKKILESYHLDTYSGQERAKKEFVEFMKTQPRRSMYSQNSMNSRGNFLVRCKNVNDCYIAVRLEDCSYMERGDTVKDCYDCSTGGEQELCYETLNADHSYGSYFTNYCHTDTNIWYSDCCQSCENVFGCVGLKSSQYCILNKQYSKEEYESIKNKLVKKMKDAKQFGEFFPSKLSPFCYNETLAQQYYPLTKEKALQLGHVWQDNFAKTQGQETLKVDEIADNIDDIDKSIINEVLLCIICKRNYKIIEREYNFYKFNHIPVPRRCFNCRLEELYREMGSMVMYSRNCAKCDKNIETSYSPDRPEIVFCESCYNIEIS